MELTNTCEHVERYYFAERGGLSAWLCKVCGEWVEDQYEDLGSGG